MTRERDILLLVGDMLAALDEIDTFAQVGEAVFLGDLRTQRAIERSFEILGEAANQLPAEPRARYADVPWRVIIDHRNRLIHGYASVEPARVWQTIVRDLPGLRVSLERLHSLIRGEQPDQ
ncbi:HepT-like ribonuclease domain-containing protein [Thauera sinica]|uniref:DUF86 domain-containing protein n=1 Tax=Thauera sinica TaxID=2665146 RepID=A0ABW1ARF8_9RHOO|nr:HepT-like ribonuclease domain-containing protein [Thauera sp. K11]ATE62133.1 DUF86 domain-containing protein [Thauera sp. K11]